MLLAGIVESGDKASNLIYNIMKSCNRKVVLQDLSSFWAETPRACGENVAYLSDAGTDMLLLRINSEECHIPPGGLKLDFIVYVDRECRDRTDGNDPSPDIVARLHGLLDDNGIVIVSADNTELIRRLRGLKLYTITYGFNSRASVTTSSTGEGIYKDSFLFCLQRTLPTRGGRSLEPQEYIIKLPAGEYDAYTLLAAATFAAVNDIDLNRLAINDFAKC